MFIVCLFSLAAVIAADQNVYLKKKKKKKKKKSLLRIKCVYCNVPTQVNFVKYTDVIDSNDFYLKY